jgi:8-oxo-dGTP pyrophosphatase MutT (NUDIX family)
MLPEFNAWFLKRLLNTAKIPAIPKDAAFEYTSVFFLVFSKDESPFLLAILKADNPGYPWRNQVALPGGHVDKNDISPLEAAYREIEEEVGIHRSQIELIGSMGHFQTIGHKDIEVFMGIWDGNKDILTYDPKEISEIFEIPIGDLLKKHLSSHFQGRIPNIEELLYPFKEVVVWGVTARIFHYFFELVRTNLDDSVIHQLQNNT